MIPEIKILMIDDDDEDFIIVKDLLSEINHFKLSISWSPSYKDGLRNILEKKHDIYLVDYRLGADNGLDLISEVLINRCDVPFILLTGQNDLEIDKQAMKVGVADYLVKGAISSSLLERTIRYSIEHAKNLSEIKQLNADLEKKIIERTKILEEAFVELKKTKSELESLLIKEKEVNKITECAKEKAESAAKIAEEAMKAKQQFLANMSHEIRTPMTAIIGFAKVVLKTDLTTNQKEYITAIKTSGDSLLVLINDILDLAKVNAGKMTFEQVPFKMEQDIAAMLNLFDLKFQERNLELIKVYDSNIPEWLVGDPVRLNQIILNLVSNAIKFTEKGKITVSVCLLNEDEEKATLKFSVTDTGIGIPENMTSTIFENFEQATCSTARLFGGTGLGLAIVKQLVERQGGTINVKSKINEGSTFSFILGFQKTKAGIELESDLVKLDSEIGKIKVLVVEDVALNQLLMKILLDDFGFERDIANNGKEALEKLQTKSYDIILMDLQMPEMNGFEATEHIRNKMKSKIPIIALTADVTVEDLAQCKAVGMNEHIAKPIDEKLLYNKIIGLVRKKK